MTCRNGRAFHRCTYLDWREDFWEIAAAHGWRVFYLGGAPGVAETAAASIRKARPGASIAVRDGFFDMMPGSAEARSVLDDITAFASHILLVGMGMPRQEIWIHCNYDALPPCVVLPVGAAFDYEAGVQRAAPRWMGRMAVEWLFRLAVDPRRLFRRYCGEPWQILGLSGGLVSREVAPGRRAVTTTSGSPHPHDAEAQSSWAIWHAMAPIESVSPARG